MMLLLAGVLGSSLHGPVPALAQVQTPACQVRGSYEWLSQRPSPLDSAVVTVGGRSAKLCYSRPSTRGRKVFGELVQWNRAWRTGANEPTVLHLPFTAEVAGFRLDPGRYLLMTVPRDSVWTIVFFVADGTDPVELFETMKQVGLGRAASEIAEEHVETLTITGTAGETVGELVLAWELIRVRIPVRLLR